MSEQEYKDKIKVRGQLSQADRLRILEYEFLQAVEFIQKNTPDEHWPSFMKIQGLEPILK